MAADEDLPGAVQRPLPAADLVGGLRAAGGVTVDIAEGIAVGQPNAQHGAVALGGQHVRSGQRCRSAPDQFAEPGEIGAPSPGALSQRAGQGLVQVGVEHRPPPAVRVLAVHRRQPPVGLLEADVGGQRPAYGHCQQHAFAELAATQRRHCHGATTAAGDSVEQVRVESVRGEGVGGGCVGGRDGHGACSSRLGAGAGRRRHRTAGWAAVRRAMTFRRRRSAMWSTRTARSGQ